MASDHAVAEHLNFAGGWFQQRADGLERRCFSRSVRPHETVQRLRHDGKGHLIESQMSLERMRKIIH